jgi:hypothetical protein
MWAFLQKKKNREVLGWLGAGLVVAAGGFWTAFVYFDSPHKSPTKALRADCGSVAIGGDVSGATITAGNSLCSQQGTDKKP